MRTWWIVRYGSRIMVLSDISAENFDNALGPYWSYKDAMNVLRVWSK